MSPLEDHVLIALRRISQAIDVWSRRLLREFDLTAPQLATLREIIAGQNSTPVTLAAALHLSQPTVTGILHRLEERGLIKRERSNSDRRSVLAVITERGRDLVRKAPPLLRDRFREELSKLSELQQTEILTVLQRVASMMNAPEALDAPFLFIGKEESLAEDLRNKTNRAKRNSARRKNDRNRKGVRAKTARQ
jgi:DNA-binding MarR family transcriptional regulator